MTDREIFDILGIEEVNRHESRYLLSQFRKLCEKHNPNKIWLKGDYEVGYAVGIIVDRTDDLVVVEDYLLKSN